MGGCIKMISEPDASFQLVQSVVEKTLEADPGACRRSPLVAAAPVDGRFDCLPEIAHPAHLLPEDLQAGARSVIVYFLPYVRSIPASNIKGDLSSREWAQAYVDTNALVSRINQNVSDELQTLGFHSAVTPATHNFRPEELVSGWSHKHIAVLCGLGTLGVHTQLITPSGCGGRLGSLVTQAPLPEVRLIEEGIELCKHKRGEECQVCIEKCRFGALTLNGFDRFRCYEMLMTNDAHFSDLPLTDVCAKCVSLAPCTFGPA